MDATQFEKGILFCLENFTSWISQNKGYPEHNINFCFSDLVLFTWL